MSDWKDEHFGTLTPRMAEFKKELIEAKPYIDATRAVLATKAYQTYAKEPVIKKRALMLKNILEKMPVFIEDHTLLVGNQAKINRAAPVFPEYAMEWVINELDEFEKRDGDAFYIEEETKQQLREIAPFWEGNTLLDKGLSYMPPEAKVYYDLGIIKAEGNLTSGDAHLGVDYQRVINYGLKEFRERTVKAKDNLDLTDYKNLKKYHFYEAILIVIDAVQSFAERYQKLALELAKQESDGKRKAELLEIARVMGKVPYEPADSFYEAVQSVWFIQLILQIESNGHSLSYGRLDQYLYPFLEKDLRDGKITEEQALELLTNLWMKTYTINKVRSWSHTQFSAGSPLYQNVTIGGQTPDKKDAVNKLTFLVLRSVAQTRLSQPNLTVRYHAGMSKEFMDECIEVLRLGMGMPSFNSDEVIVPSFIEKGVAEHDAYNYSAIGCMEVAVPGKWGYRVAGMSFINMPKTLLIAMNGGVNLETGTKLIDGLKHFKEMKSYEELKDAWDAAIKEITRQSVIIENSCDVVLEENVPDVLCSALTEDCIGRGLALKEGGAVYDFIAGLQVGMANLADSLAAVKKLVFEEKKISPEELWDALVHDFRGEKGKMIQKILIEDAPKYGNDNDYVDDLLVDAYMVYVNEIKKYPNTRYKRGPIGGGRFASTGTISANVGQGLGTLATPDGRNAHEPLAEGSSPFHGMDTKGPTGVFKTLSKLPTHEMLGGVLLNQKVTPALLSKEENKEKLEQLIRTFFDRLEGFHVQYNVVDKETLLDAQRHPEQYKDLVVRVAGYSAFFNVLSKTTQDDIIARTEQSL